jgi:hypothetical protein
MPSASANEGTCWRKVAHADDHDLAQPTVERGLPAHRVRVVEPALGERGRVEQHAVNVDQSAAAPGAKSLDRLRQFGMLLLLDQGHASHEYLHRVSGT